MADNRFKNENLNSGTRRIPFSFPTGENIIYLSSDGSEENDGLSKDTPRYNVRRVPEYLNMGYSVLLKAGSVWYEPNIAWKLCDIAGTPEAPLLVSTYGEGAAPVIGDMHAIYADEWRTEENGIYSAEAVGDVVRFYINDRIYTEVETDAELCKESFLQKGGRVYIKANELPSVAEYLSFEEDVEPEHFIFFKNVSYLTLQNFVMKGCALWAVVYGNAPSDHLTFDHMEIRSMYKYAMSIGADTENAEAYNNCLTVTNSVIERTWSADAFSCFRKDIYEQTRTTDAIFLTNAHVGAYIAGNIMRDYGHTGINLHASNRFAGIRNCVIERNVVSGTNSAYLRACEVIGPDGMCTNNIVRYNYFYDLTNSSHLMGDNNKYYCNVFAYIVPTEASKNIQPYAIDSMTWKWEDYEFVSRGNLYANNTIYNCACGMAFNSNVYENIFANNIITGWSYPGAVRMGSTKAPISLYNNCFYGGDNDNVLYGSSVEGDCKLADLNAKEQSAGNIFADPEFINAECDDFALSQASPCAMAGKPLSEITDEEYLDINGVPFDKEHPSIGAFSALV